MDKLIRFINEYGHTNNCGPFETYRIEPATERNSSYLVFSRDDNGEGDWKDWHLTIPRLISKEYGFIKRLVENDKIDTDPIRTRVKRVYVELEPREFTPQDFVDRVIMLLSISSSPIDDLISYLK